MRKIYLAIGILFFQTMAFSQNTSTCSTPSSTVCSSTVNETFTASAGGFTSANFTYNNTNGSFQRTFPGAATTTSTITSSGYYKTGTMPNAVQAGFLLTFGAKLTVTSVTLEILDASNDAVIASCTQSGTFTSGQTVCFGISDLDIQTGMYIKYRFIISTTNDGTGSAGQNTLTFDNFSFGGTSNAALPVKLDNFDAATANNGIKLTWIASDEQTLSRFEIERSANGSSFSKIGTVAAENKKNYSYVDVAPNATNNYYRLKMIDLDGKVRISYIVSVKAKSALGIETYPNPVRNNLLVQHPKAKEAASIQLVNMQGQLVKSVDVPVNAVATQVDVTSLKSGAYYLIFRSSTENFSQRIVKQ